MTNTIRTKYSEALEEIADEMNYDTDNTKSVFQKVPQEPRKTSVKLGFDILESYFPGKSAKEIKKEIIQILNDWKSRQEV